MAKHALVVLAHPEIKSFNGGLAQVAEDTLKDMGWTVERSNLTQTGFDPVERAAHYPNIKNTERFDSQTEQRHAADTNAIPDDVTAELEKIERADFLFIQFPVWWFAAPAVLKGWFDRCLLYGRVYTSKQRYDAGKFKGKRAMVSATTGGPESTLAYNGRNGDIELLLWPTNMTLAYVGFSVLPPFTSFEVGGAIAYSGEDESIARRERDKKALADRLRAMDTTPPLRFNGWGDWDEKGQLKPGVEGYSYFMRAKP